MGKIVAHLFKHLLRILEDCGFQELLSEISSSQLVKSVIIYFKSHLFQIHVIRHTLRRVLQSTHQQYSKVCQDCSIFMKTMLFTNREALYAYIKNYYIFRITHNKIFSTAPFEILFENPRIGHLLNWSEIYSLF